MALRPVFLKGDSIVLRPLHPDDTTGPYLNWFNDEEVCRGNSHHVFPFTEAVASEYISYSHRSKDDLILAIDKKTNNQHIGNIALQRIHPVYRSAELSIIIGEKSAWGKGYGLEAVRLMCDHAFRTLNLHRVACGTFGSNEGMIHLALSIGMKEEGRRKEAVFKDGQYIDVIEFGILRDEYLKK
ncbi:MAG: GNAT family protein [Methanoregula sp.]|nr:GNAT family protein [Methanoregula sp.]